ncbi:DNA primase [Candidatus Nomurabacteria bacterium CG10_big_fil_rev_8_21_14_0_10_35_16]|uniref:DNA primase n=1 Tax=Candidatus Nomurabacteria bacterium CG10_big_fil_rev_8_21_14_0_10_35_16 TaxID=1974731 RepID=A0A2H0TAZ6_9BACT|nr:MAG: DNA primase [Candidatus Nomurabacteria bacterium CG10_big_fil_rev_8_21_14_0_10_35_16]
MNSPVDQIKERLSIEEVVSSYIKLDKAGSNLKAKCPFHNEKTPSFFISPDRGTYYCFGCGASGDIFSFVEEFEGLDFKGALKLLAARAGIELSNYSKEKASEKDKLLKAMETATSHFIKNLANNTEVLNYLKSRGLEEKSIKDFKIGFAKDAWRDLYDFLKTQGFNDLEIEKAGLAKKTEKGFYDRFRNRIMFPITDSSGRIIAFSGRIFVDDGKSPKYLNSPDTPIFNKSAVLYGLDKAKDSIRKNNFSILVEGQMDLILSHQSMYRNTIATSGTALADSEISKENVVSNLGLVRRLSNNLVLAFDGDKAGISATSRAGKIALSLGMDVKIASLPLGMDPADLIHKNGVDAWRSAIKDSKHIIEFLLTKIIKDFDNDTRKVGREVKEKLLPYVDALASSIEKAHFLKKISDLTSIPVSALEADLKKIEQEQKYEKREIENTIENSSSLRRKDYIERKLLGLILWQQTLTEKSIDVEKILSEFSEILNKKPEDVLASSKENREDLIFEAEVFYKNASLEQDIRELLDNLLEENLKEKLGRKMRELYLAEEQKDKEKSVEILKTINEINLKIQNIKNNNLK